MKLSTIIKDYFTFNRKEQRGIFVLLTILMLLVIGNEVAPLVIKAKPVDFSGFEKEIAAFEKAMARADSNAELEKKNRYKGFGYRSAAGSTDSGKSLKPYPKEVFIIELNSADTFELQRLRGIGSSFARRIVKYRERLGGFISKKQLLEIWGMDTSRYNAIDEHLTVNPDSVHKIDLNTVTFKEMLSHPYFPFEVTKAIMLYRKEHKKFGGIEELKSIKAIPDSAYRKMEHYVKVSF
ncbi:MAG: helix-hairpin-helix domain-containing protein [Bacteroidetes bacterium]|nr:helix-hairpin-helix domain-containing protein [Bacteroidota bacterium]